jgi:hypothetical protein
MEWNGYLKTSKTVEESLQLRIDEVRGSATTR